MRINDLRTRIVFECSETVSDEYDNRVTRWSSYYACWATMLTSTGSEPLVVLLRMLGDDADVYRERA